MREEEKAHFGQKIRTESAPVRCSHDKGDKKEALLGRKMGGGMNDVSHSLSGAGDVVTYNDKGSSRR